MALPDLIEIIPLDKPVRAEITVPGSKSITNRDLILAALADGETTLFDALWSEDTEVMVEALKKLGCDVIVRQGGGDACNRTIRVKGFAGKIPRGGTIETPLELYVGNAGTAARFLAALVCLGRGAYRLQGVPRMHERPQAALLHALRELGYQVDSPNDKLPAVIHGAGSKHGRCTVSVEESSQFASALLLCAERGGWQIEITGENSEESPYVEMTKKLIATFPSAEGIFHVEPDASSGSYFWAAGRLLQAFKDSSDRKSGRISGFDLDLYLRGRKIQSTNYPVQVLHWPNSDLQIDQNFPALLPELSSFKGTISRATDLGDSIMTAIVLAPFASGPCRFTDLGRLRVQETERVFALRKELTECGAKVVEEGDTLIIDPANPGELHGAKITTYNDHRMAMCFAILGLKVPGIKIHNPSCVKKTFPNFFQKLAAPPPGGLGAEIRDGRTGRKLGMDELFAD